MLLLFFFHLICMCDLEYCQYNSDMSLLWKVFNYSWDCTRFPVTETQVLLAVIHRSHSFITFVELNDPKLMQWLALFKDNRSRTIPWTRPLAETGKAILSINHSSTAKWLSKTLDECAFSKEEPDPSMSYRDSVKSELKNPFKHFIGSFMAFSSSILYLRQPSRQNWIKLIPSR